MKRLYIILFSIIFLQACSKVDDYMLGKDNTPQPKELKPVKAQIKVSKNWSVASGKPSKIKDYLKLKPLILGNIIYTAQAPGTLQAINKADGAKLWATQLKEGIVSGPTAGSGYLAVGTNAASVVVLSQKDGKIIWDNKVSGDILSPPAITQNKVIAKTIDGKVYAFDIAQGKSLWVADHGAPSLVLKASSSPVILGNLVLIGYSDGKLDALDIDNGQLMWQRSIAYASGGSDVERLVDIDADPIVKDNTAYIASYQGYIGALSLADGQFLWRKPGSVYKNMILDGDTLYFADSRDVLWSLNRKNGQVHWKQNAFKARGLTEPILVNNQLVVADKTGYLHVISKQSGEVLARTQLSAGVDIAPSAHGKKIYVLTNNGLLNQLSVG